MRNKNVLIVLCACSLLIGGCGTKQASESDSTKQPDPAQTEQAQPEKTPDNTANSAEPAETAENTTQPDDGTADASYKTSADKSSKISGISEQEALDIALKHADVKESDMTSKRIKKEYDYEISVSDGKIIKHDFETDNKNNQKSSQSGKEISINEAKKIALDKIPGAKKIQIKKDKDDGRVVYEGEIHYNNVEYDFKIDASTGKLIKWEEDDD